MALEIERKWLVDPASLPFRLSEFPSHRIVQSYVSFHPQIRIRDIDQGSAFFITVKVSGGEEAGELVRKEFEACIDESSYAALLQDKVGKTLEKTRYFVPDGGGHTFEIDVYEGEYDGLIVAEMEFADEKEAEAYPGPDWSLRDISTDPYYKNVVMAQQ